MVSRIVRLMIVPDLRCGSQSGLDHSHTYKVSDSRGEGASMPEQEFLQILESSN